MQNKKNKVKYNLKNTHYAMLTVSEDGVVSYGTPLDGQRLRLHLPALLVGLALDARS